MAENEATKDKPSPDIVKIPTAKRSKLLLDIADQLKGMEVSDIFDIANHKYLISTLTADEEVWADSYSNLNSQLSAFTSLRVPRLAAAIKSIDGKDVEELFDFSDDMSEEDKKYHMQSQYRKRYWVMNQMLLMLGDMPGRFIDELWNAYSSLATRRDDSWNELKKSSERTLGGESKAMLSPEKGSSQATMT